jgi:hypothetical protein
MNMVLYIYGWSWIFYLWRTLKFLITAFNSWVVFKCIFCMLFHYDVITLWVTVAFFTHHYLINSRVCHRCAHIYQEECQFSLEIIWLPHAKYTWAISVSWGIFSVICERFNSWTSYSTGMSLVMTAMTLTWNRTIWTRCIPLMLCVSHFYISMMAIRLNCQKLERSRMKWKLNQLFIGFLCLEWRTNSRHSNRSSPFMVDRLVD